MSYNGFGTISDESTPWRIYEELGVLVYRLHHPLKELRGEVMFVMFITRRVWQQFIKMNGYERPKL